MTNLVPRQYREVAVASVDFPLDGPRISVFLLGREVYRRTRYVVLRHRADSNGPETAVAETAVAEVTKEAGDQLMAPVTSVSVLALPAQCVFVDAPDADTGIPTALARVALAQEAPSVRCVVVEGRYHHVNFILDPDPLAIRVVDVVPPGPPKLVDQAERILAIAEELPPIELVAQVTDLTELARSSDASRYLLPCRGSGFAVDGGPEVAFLDERPPRQEWTLIGCSRSRDLHRWFYGDLPETVDMCPRSLAAGWPSGVVTLTKCCLLEDRIECSGDTVVVPWGASLDQVRQGLGAAADLAAARSGSDTPRSEATWSHA